MSHTFEYDIPRLKEDSSYSSADLMEMEEEEFEYRYGHSKDEFLEEKALGFMAGISGEKLRQLALEHLPVTELMANAEELVSKAKDQAEQLVSKHPVPKQAAQKPKKKVEQKLEHKVQEQQQSPAAKKVRAADKGSTRKATNEVVDMLDMRKQAYKAALAAKKPLDIYVRQLLKQSRGKMQRVQINLLRKAIDRDCKEKNILVGSLEWVQIVKHYLPEAPVEAVDDISAKVVSPENDQKDSAAETKEQQSATRQAAADLSSQKKRKQQTSAKPAQKEKKSTAHKTSPEKALAQEGKVPQKEASPEAATSSEEALKAETPAASPLQGMQEAPGSQMLQRYNEKLKEAPQKMAEQVQKAQEALPKLKTPIGLAAHTEGTEEGTEAAPAAVPLPKTASLSQDSIATDSQEAVVKETPLQDFEQKQKHPDITVPEEAEELDPEQQATEAVAQINLDTEKVPDSIGETPQIPAEGATDPNAQEQHSAQARQEAQEGAAEAHAFAQNDFGEEAILPVADDSMLQSEKTLSVQTFDAPSAEMDLPQVPAELAAEVDKQMGTAMEPAIAKEQSKAEEAAEAKQKETESAQEEANAEIAALEDKAAQEQLAEKEKAAKDIETHKGAYQAEVEQARQNFDAEVQAKGAATDQKTAAERQKGEAQAQAHYAEAEEKASKEKAKAEAKATQQKDEKKKEKKGFWSKVKGAVSALVDAVKDAVNAIFEGLRNLVKGIFEAAKKLATAAINLAAKAITLLIKVFAEAMKALVKVLFAFMPGLQKRLLGAIDQVAQKALTAVKKAAEKLKKAVVAALDLVANIIDTALNMVQQLYNMAFTAIGMIVRGEFKDLGKYLFKSAVSIVFGALKSFLSLLGINTEALDHIINDPVGFFKNLVQAIKGGLKQFVQNIKQHLMQGVAGWLFGTLNIEIDASEGLSFKTIMKVVFAVLKMNYATVRKRAFLQMNAKEKVIYKKIEKGIDPEAEARVKEQEAAARKKAKEEAKQRKEMAKAAKQNMAKVPKVAAVKPIQKAEEADKNEQPKGFFKEIVSLVADVATNGPGALIPRIMEYVGDMRSTILGAIIAWLRNTIIVKAIQKLVLMFNPVGAIVQVIQAIIKIVTFIRERWDQIVSFCQAVMQSITDIAFGRLSKAKNGVEDSLAKVIPIAIGFLAKLIGISGLGRKIKKIIKKFQLKVVKAIDKVVKKVLKPIRKFLKSKLGSFAQNKLVSAKEEKAQEKEDQKEAKLQKQDEKREKEQEAYEAEEEKKQQKRKKALKEQKQDQKQWKNKRKQAKKEDKQARQAEEQNWKAKKKQEQEEDKQRKAKEEEEYKALGSAEEKASYKKQKEKEARERKAQRQIEAAERKALRKAEQARKAKERKKEKEIHVAEQKAQKRHMNKHYPSLSQKTLQRGKYALNKKKEAWRKAIFGPDKKKKKKEKVAFALQVDKKTRKMLAEVVNQELNLLVDQYLGKRIETYLNTSNSKLIGGFAATLLGKSLGLLLGKYLVPQLHKVLESYAKEKKEALGKYDDTDHVKLIKKVNEVFEKGVKAFIDAFLNGQTSSAEKRSTEKSEKKDAPKEEIGETTEVIIDHFVEALMEQLEKSLGIKKKKTKGKSKQDKKKERKKTEKLGEKEMDMVLFVLDELLTNLIHSHVSPLLQEHLGANISKFAAGFAGRFLGKKAGTLAGELFADHLVQFFQNLEKRKTRLKDFTPDVVEKELYAFLEDLFKSNVKPLIEQIFDHNEKQSETASDPQGEGNKAQELIKQAESGKLALTEPSIADAAVDEFTAALKQALGKALGWPAAPKKSKGKKGTKKTSKTTNPFPKIELEELDIVFQVVDEEVKDFVDTYLASHIEKYLGTSVGKMLALPMARNMGAEAGVLIANHAGKYISYFFEQIKQAQQRLKNLPKESLEADLAAYLNGLFHQNLKALVGKLFKEDSAAKEAESSSKEALADVMVDEFIHSFKYALKACLQGDVYKESVWELSALERGEVIEEKLGGNLPKNFPVLDLFENGEATSIKSIDVSAKSYQKKSPFSRKLKGYVKELAQFTGAKSNGIEIKASDIQQRELKIVLQQNKLNANQQEVLREIKAYGQTQSVRVQIIHMN